MTKLKTLLARMHQASQRHTEESVAIKKVQKKAAKEIESVRSKDELEKKVLELQLRRLEIESAFKEDVEISIQRAAQAVTQAYSGKSAYVALEGKGDHSGRGALPALGAAGALAADVESPKCGGTPQSELIEQVEALTSDVVALKQQLDSALHQSAAYKKTQDTLQMDLASEKKRSAYLQMQLTDENLLRRDMEAELNIILAREGRSTRDIEAQMASSADKRAAELNDINREYERRVAELTVGLAASTQQLDKAKKEVASFRSTLQGMRILERENKQLTIMLKEFRRNHERSDSAIKTQPAVDAVSELVLPEGAVCVDEASLRKSAQSLLHTCTI